MPIPSTVARFVPRRCSRHRPCGSCRSTSPIPPALRPSFLVGQVRAHLRPCDPRLPFPQAPRHLRPDGPRLRFAPAPTHLRPCGLRLLVTVDARLAPHIRAVHHPPARRTLWPRSGSASRLSPSVLPRWARSSCDPVCHHYACH